MSNTETIAINETATADIPPGPNKEEMLYHLGKTCERCGMCDLGYQTAKRDNIERDPHVFADYIGAIPRYMVVGQNPGWNEVLEGKPFVGAAGRTFNLELIKHGCRRSDFYICNVVRCYKFGNTAPTREQLERCEPFLRMEIGIIKPRLVIALGSVAFSSLCPDATFSESLGKITTSVKFGVKVFATYHPSPLNLQDHGRRLQFSKDIAILCQLVTALDTREIF